MNFISRCLLLSGFILVLGACSTNPLKHPEPQQHPMLINDAASMNRVPVLQNGAIYQLHTNKLLFNDLKARRPGDLITVILSENTVAAKSASTRSSKDTTIDIPAPTLLGTGVTRKSRPLSTNVEGGNSFSGTGDSNQSNSLNGNITVTVIDTTATGNLVIQGEKLLTLNSGHEVISISGIVRPVDITPENTVVSNLIADAKIVYSGKGLIADSNRAGWLTRLVNGKFWPF